MLISHILVLSIHSISINFFWSFNSYKSLVLVLVLFPKTEQSMITMLNDTLLVNTILCASFLINWHCCPQNILVLVFNYLF